MLARALPLAGDGLSFAPGDIGAFGDTAAWDLVFANAALQWVPDHPRLFARLTAALRPDGQLAVQMPYNADHASHVVAAEVAAEEPFVSAMGGAPPEDPVRGVLPPAQYAELLYDLGYVEQHVRMQVYGHVLDDTAAVVEWTSGTTLVRFRRALPADLYAEFVTRYRDRLVDRLGHRSPFFYAFKRILLWARRR
jgi:trans-aconitate 2-methyltransferase